MDEEVSTPAHCHRTPRRYSAPRTNWIQSRGKPISHECLRQHAFFKDRDPKLLDLLLEAITVEVFLPGADIVTEGEEGNCMYFMYRGEVEILVGPERKQVATLKDGSLFGEMALLGNGKRAATIRALKVCDCRVINAPAFHTALRRFPAEKFFFHQLAKERLAEINKTKGGKDKRGSVVLKEPASEAFQKFKKASQAVVAGVRMGKGSISAPTSRTTTCTDDHLCIKDRSPKSLTNTFDDNLLIKDEATSPRSPRSPSSGSSAVARRRSLQICLDTALDNFVRPPTAVREPTLEDNILQNYIPPSSAPAYGAIESRNGRRRSDVAAVGSIYNSNRSCSTEDSSQQAGCSRYVSGGAFDLSTYLSNSSCSSYSSNQCFQQNEHGRRASDTTFDACKYSSNGSCSSESQSPVSKAGNRRSSMDYPAAQGWTPQIQHDAMNCLPTLRLGATFRRDGQQTARMIKAKDRELSYERARSR